jgi:hypothetical protein
MANYSYMSASLDSILGSNERRDTGAGIIAATAAAAAAAAAAATLGVPTVGLAGVLFISPAGLLALLTKKACGGICSVAILYYLCYGLPPTKHLATVGL